jgi:hypothetical protein
MMSSFRPSDSGSFAVPIIDNDVQILQEIVDRLKSIVAVATATPDGQLNVDFIATKDTRFFDLLKEAKRATRIMLPLYICTVKYRSTSDVSPDSIG